MDTLCSSNLFQRVAIFHRPVTLYPPHWILQLPWEAGVAQAPSGQEDMVLSYEAGSSLYFLENAQYRNATRRREHAWWYGKSDQSTDRRDSRSRAHHHPAALTLRTSPKRRPNNFREQLLPVENRTKSREEKMDRDREMDRRARRPEEPVEGRARTPEPTIDEPRRGGAEDLA